MPQEMRRTDVRMFQDVAEGLGELGGVAKGCSILERVREGRRGMQSAGQSLQGMDRGVGGA